MRIKPAIAVSGGIDSLTASFLLKKNYPDLFGIHFSTGYETEASDLSSISQQLGIDIKCVDLSSLFEKKVVNYFVKSYLKGITPNPCLFCNKIIKFGYLFDAAASFGADAIATGHYACIKQSSDGRTLLAAGRDPLKEQSYFLSLLSPEQLERAIFPLGNMTKEKVRQIAETENLEPIEKHESQDICFLKNCSLQSFLYTKTKTKPAGGDIVTVDGRRIGSHNGLHKFTVGQRRGINCPASQPYYVKRIDIKNNRLIVSFKEHLSEKRFYADHMNWIKTAVQFPFRAFTKVRYSHKGENATVIQHNEGVEVVFDKPQYAVAPGQGVVFYDGDEVIGGGIIT